MTTLLSLTAVFVPLNLFYFVAQEQGSYRVYESYRGLAVGESVPSSSRRKDDARGASSAVDAGGDR